MSPIRLRMISSLIRGTHSGCDPKCGASAVLPRGFAIRAGAASGIRSFGITAEARGAVAGLGQDEAGNARSMPGPRKRGAGAEPGWMVLARTSVEAPEGERAPKGALPRRSSAGGNVFDGSRLWHAPSALRLPHLLPGATLFFRVVVATARTHRRREMGWFRLASVSEAIQLACAGSWIASSRSLLAMTRSEGEAVTLGVIAGLDPAFHGPRWPPMTLRSHQHGPPGQARW